MKIPEFKVCRQESCHRAGELQSTDNFYINKPNRSNGKWYVQPDCKRCTIKKRTEREGTKTMAQRDHDKKILRVRQEIEDAQLEVPNMSGWGILDSKFAPKLGD